MTSFSILIVHVMLLIMYVLLNSVAYTVLLFKFDFYQFIDSFKIEIVIKGNILNFRYNIYNS